MSVRVSAEAEAELDEIWYHVATESGSVDVAQRLINAIDDQISLLSRHPFLGRHRDDLRSGLRSIVVGEYVVIYRIVGEDVLILDILHGHRDIGSMF